MNVWMCPHKKKQKSLSITLIFSADALTDSYIPLCSYLYFIKTQSSSGVNTLDFCFCSRFGGETGWSFSVRTDVSCFLLLTETSRNNLLWVTRSREAGFEPNDADEVKMDSWKINIHQVFTSLSLRGHICLQSDVHSQLFSYSGSIFTALFGDFVLIHLLTSVWNLVSLKLSEVCVRVLVWKLQSQKPSEIKTCDSNKDIQKHSRTSEQRNKELKKRKKFRERNKGDLLFPL